MRKFGYKSGFLIGLALFSIGCAICSGRQLSFRAIRSFSEPSSVIASGARISRDSVESLHRSIGGSTNRGRRLNLAQAFNPLGAITGAVVGTVFIFSGIELRSGFEFALLDQKHEYVAYLRRETMRVVAPYVVLSAVTLLMLVLLAVTRFPAALRQAEQAESDHGNFAALLQCPRISFWLSRLSSPTWAPRGARGGSISSPTFRTIFIEEKSEKVAGYFLSGTLVLLRVFGAIFSLRG